MKLAEINLNFDVVTALLDYGLIGLGLLLAILMYNLLYKAQNKQELNPKLFKLIKFYFILSLSFFLLSTCLEVFEQYIEKVASLEVDATDPNLWKGNPEEYEWFNAQYRLANDRLLESNVAKIEKGVKYELLFFQGIDSIDIAESKKRFDRMRVFLNNLSRKTDVNPNNMKIKMVYNKRIPLMSFFNTVKGNRPVVIYYLDELMEDSGEPIFACQVVQPHVVRSFDRRFDDNWESAHAISLERILNLNVSTEWFYNIDNIMYKE